MTCVEVCLAGWKIAPKARLELTGRPLCCIERRADQSLDLSLHLVHCCGLDAPAKLRLKAGEYSSEARLKMDIYLDRRAVRQIRLSAQEAIEEGDTESLREDILEALTEEQVEEIERRLDNGDFFEFLTDILDEWSGDDTDELFELLETQLGEVGIDLKFDGKNAEEEEEEDDDEDDDDFDEEEEEEDFDE
jgi:hypothetical protein